MPELLHFLNNGVGELPAAILFFVFFFATFVSEDIACLAAGSAVASGHLSFALALSACFFGIFVGDMLLFGTGRLIGQNVFDNRLVRRMVSSEAQARASNWLEKNGATAVFLSRFVTGLRLPTYLAAGALRTDLKSFTAYFLLASAIWTPILVGASAYSQTAIFRENALLGIVLLAVLSWLSVKYSSWRHRRLLIGRLKRIANWEFWPVQVFYAPVVLYVLFLAIKYRGLTIFTAVNPAIPAGGFKGESKNDIYKALARSSVSQPYLLDHLLIEKCDPTRDRLRRAWRFIDDHGLSFPLVVKPNAGERGRDVRIVNTLDELNTALVAAESDLILQEHVGGEEVSIFYHRYPGQARGRIFSITQKRFPILVGDGRLTVEELILSDPRAVCMAGKYFEHNDDKLDHVPTKGETVRLIDIGTHSRGAIFLDGNWLRTEALESKIDEICRAFDGFDFGRFDIRVPTFADLRRGAKFKIIELNGVASESTNIYDPRYSLTDAYRTLFRQWQIAFEIGAENIKLGARRTGLIDLLRMGLGLTAVAGKALAAH